MNEGRIVVVCGGRGYSNHGVVNAALDAEHKWFTIGLLVQGGADGADRLAREWADRNGVACATIPANWTKHGKAAGPIRNEIMAQIAQDVIYFPGGRGSADMRERARKYVGGAIDGEAVALGKQEPGRVSPVPEQSEA